MGKTITDIPGIGPSTAEVLAKNGFKTLQQIAGSTVEKLAAVPGFGMIRAARVIKLANALPTAPVTKSSPVARTRAKPKRAVPKASKPAAASDAEKQEAEKPKKDKSTKDKSKKGKKKDKSNKDKKKDKSKKGKKKDRSKKRKKK